MNPMQEEWNKTSKKTTFKKDIQNEFEEETRRKLRHLPADIALKFKESVNSYIKQGYKIINSILRVTTSENLLDIGEEAKKLNKWEQSEVDNTINEIKNLDEGFKNLTTTSDITVYRRTGGDILGYPISERGNLVKEALDKLDNPEKKEWLLQNIIEKYRNSTISDRGYLSTSFSEKFKNNSFEKRSVHFEIFVPKGTRAVTITPKEFSGYISEKELLLDRGYKMQVKDIKIAIIEGQNKIFIKAEIIPNNIDTFYFL